MNERTGTCLCGHGPETHCPDGECIGGGLASDRVSFACGCQNWRTPETEARRLAFLREFELPATSPGDSGRTD